MDGHIGKRRRDGETKRRSGRRRLAHFVSPSLRLFVSIALLTAISGCSSSAVSTGSNTALDGVDLVRMTDDMAMQIAGDPQVNDAYRRSGPLTIVVQPVENIMTAEVLPRGPAEAFTGRVRSLLSRHDGERFVWVMNRDAFYRLRKQELDFDLGPAPEATSPEYALTAKFSSLADEDRKRRKSAYLCTYELTNLQTRETLWTGRYEVAKVAVKGFLD
jgi:hypothetical protein